MSKKLEQVGNTAEVKPAEKKRGGCGSFFMGFIFCLIFLVVAIGGVGLYCYYNVTISQVENILGLKLPVEGDIRDKAIKDLIPLVVEYKNSYTEASLQTIETDFGIKLPEKIPGTEIGLSVIYDSPINFLGTNKKVKEYRIQDIANNLDAFVKSVLPIFYDNTTVKQVLDSLQVTILKDLNYPAIADKYYNVGTHSQPLKKSLNELTIAEALDLLPKHFGKDNLTMQEIQEALGLSIMPLPESGQPDIYAGLRNLLVTNITTQQLMDNIDGAFIASLVDLKGFKFAQEAQFKTTKLSGMLDLFKTFPLKDFIQVPEISITPSTNNLINAMQNITYNDLNGANIVSNIADKIGTLKLGEVVDFSKMQNLDFLANMQVAALLKDAGTELNNVLKTVYIGDFVKLSSVVTGSTDFYTDTIFKSFKTNDIYLSSLKDAIKNLKVSDVLTDSQLASSTLLAEEKEMTLTEILQAKSGITLGAILSQGQAIDFASVGGFMAVLKDTTNATFETILNDAKTIDLLEIANSKISPLANLCDLNLNEIAKSEDLSALLMSNFGTLGDLLNVDSNADGFLGIIASVSFKDLMNTPEDAIKNALTNNEKTLANLLNQTFENKLVSSVMNIKIKDLFGASPEDAFKKALAGASNERTLNDLFDLGSTGIAKYFANVKIADIMGMNPATTPAEAIKNAIIGDGKITLKDFLGNTESNGIMSMIGSVTMQDLMSGSQAGNAIMNALGASGKTLGNLLNITESSGITKIIADLQLSKLFGAGANASNAFGNIINDLKLIDVFPNINNLDNKNILKILYTNNNDITVKGLSTAVDSIKLSQIVEKTGIFTLVTNFDTLTINKINELQIKANITLGDLKTAGLISQDISGIENLTIEDLIKSYKDLQQK